MIPMPFIHILGKSYMQWSISSKDFLQQTQGMNWMMWLNVEPAQRGGAEAKR